MPQNVTHIIKKDRHGHVKEDRPFSVPLTSEEGESESLAMSQKAVTDIANELREQIGGGSGSIRDAIDEIDGKVDTLQQKSAQAEQDIADLQEGLADAGKVDDVKVNGVSVLDAGTKEANINITASVVDNDTPGDPTATATMEDGNVNIEFAHVKGERGNGIESITEEVSDQDGGINTHTIIDDDGQTHTFHTRNGQTGRPGADFQPIEDVSGLSIAQSLGDDSTKVISQKAVTDVFNEVDVDLQKITGVIDKEFSLHTGETRSTETKTSCFFKAGDKVKALVTIGSAVFDPEVDVSLTITFYDIGGNNIASHSAKAEYTFTLPSDAYSYALYAYKVNTAGTVSVHLESAESLDSLKEKVSDIGSELVDVESELAGIKSDISANEKTKSYEDSLFPVENDSLGLTGKAGQTLKVKMSTTGRVDSGWRIFGKRANGTTNQLVHKYSAKDNEVVLSEDYVDFLVSISAGVNYGTATINAYIDNWRKEVDSAMSEIPSMQEDIDTLSDDVAELKNNSVSIPAYFEENVNEVVESSVIDIANTGRNGDNFIFITDMHWESNSKKSLALIRRICDKMNVSTVIFGGDAINGRANPNEAISYFNTIAKGLKKSGTRVACVLGNHDWNSQGSGGTKFDNNGETFYAMFQKMADFDVVYGDTAYFYFDNPTAKVRYICLDTGADYKIGTAQATWIRNVIQNTASDVHIIIIMHVYITGASFYEDGQWAGYNYGISNAGATVNSIISEYIGTKTIEAVYSGHSHLDYNGMTDDMVPVVITDCDARSTLMWEAENGTITEQSFDVVCVNFTNKVINCRRIGRGKSRIIHYTPYTINVGGTLDISSLISITPTSYSVRDNMTAKHVAANTLPNRIIFYDSKATISDAGIVTGVATGYVTAVAENDNCIETFNIKVIA